MRQLAPVEHCCKPEWSSGCAFRINISVAGPPARGCRRGEDPPVTTTVLGCVQDSRCCMRSAHSVAARPGSTGTAPSLLPTSSLDLCLPEHCKFMNHVTALSPPQTVQASQPHSK